MKQTLKYLFAFFSYVAFSCASVFAVAPLPGVDVIEPLREHIPHGVVSQQRAMRAVSLQEQNKELVSRGLLIVVEFADWKLAEGNTIQAFDSLANADNYTYNGATGSCKKYYQDQSNGQYTPQFDVVGPVVLPQPLAFYGTDAASAGDDRYIVDFVIDACKGAQKMGADFSNYDQDNDGCVDLVYILYAGFSQAEGAPDSTIWPHAWDIQSALYYGNTKQTEYYVNVDKNGYITSQNLPVLDGKNILRYACSNELRYIDKTRTSIGTICHEFGHVLGLADLYHTAGGTNNEIPGSWALMSHGNYLNNGNTPPNLSVWEKYFLGWIEPEMLATTQSITLPADGKTYYMLNRTSIMPKDGPLTTDTTYYFENRQMTGWDRYLPGHGMLVWRVVYDSTEWFYNTPNNTTTRFLLVTSNGSAPYTSDLHGGRRQDVPFPGSWFVTDFEPYQHATLNDIEEDNDIISFKFTNTTTSIESPTIVNPAVNNKWYDILGQPVDITSYSGLVVGEDGKILLK